MCRRAWAKPIPADVDLTTQNVTVDTIKSSLTPKTKGVIVVHLAGWPCAMPDIKAFCESQNLFLIEDCAQAHGATINGVPVGSFGIVQPSLFAKIKSCQLVVKGNVAS